MSQLINSVELAKRIVFFHLAKNHAKIFPTAIFTRTYKPSASTYENTVHSFTTSTKTNFANAKKKKNPLEINYVTDRSGSAERGEVGTAYRRSEVNKVSAFDDRNSVGRMAKQDT